MNENVLLTPASCGCSSPPFGGEREPELCEVCYTSDYQECYDCGDVYFHEDLYQGYCQNCYTRCCNCNRVLFGDEYCDCEDNSADYDVNSIMEYDAKAPDFLSFLGKPKNKMYFGVELEVEVDSPHNLETHAERVRDALPNFVITKYDGSLDRGFEIVTAPASLEVHRERWPAFFKQTREGNLSRLLSFTPGTCGMHIHISREALAPSQLGRMIVFMYERGNTRFIERMAGRNLRKGRGADYARLGEPTKLEKVCSVVTSGSKKRAFCKGTIGRGAINTGNPDTIEFRLFRGTLKESSFFKNLEFVQALTDFCKPGVCSLKDLATPAAFREFVFKYRKNYKNLVKFIEMWDERDKNRLKEGTN